MYRPQYFDEQDPQRIHRLIEENDFATVISMTARGVEISHLPLLLDANRRPHGVLLGHMARQNKHWKVMEETGEALAIFHGPHGYISPSWYTPGSAVPTWNYAVVHCYGTVRTIHDPVWLRTLVAALVERHESTRSPRWVMALPEDFERKMLAAIVGFELEITRVEAKFKLSQNRSLADRAGVVRALEGSGVETDRDLARMMRDHTRDHIDKSPQ
jgi:transcriptional regulator